MDDLNIIAKQTGLGIDEIKTVYDKNNQDIVETICELEGFHESPKTKPELTDTQKKIKEFREILDKKDAIMESIIEKNKS